FESDGHVQHGCPTLWTRRRNLALDVHRLLLSIGIPSKVSQARPPAGASAAAAAPPAADGGVESDVAVQPAGSTGLYRVRVVGGEGVRRFAKLVGFVSEGKARLLEGALERPDAFEPSWFFPHVDAELDGLGFPAGAALRNAISSYRQDANPYGMGLARAAQIQSEFPVELEGPLARFAQGDEFYVPVTVEEAGEGPTFDLTVDGVHEYLVDNVVTHNSGGKTRRAAKMVILNVDHPDVEQFIWCKAVEERKARALAAAGFDMDLDGSDSHSIQYQNANNSVRVTDDFMEAVVGDRDWDLKAVTSGETLKTVRAKELLRQISEAAWECADPGMQFDTTINRWHTAKHTGRINASNPCFPGDALVHTDKGLIAFAELVDRVRLGESFGVYTHDATNPDAPAERLEITTPEAVMITGFNEIVKLSFSNGMDLRCTPNHRIFTTNRGYVQASELTVEDEVKVLDLPAPAVNADRRIPVSTDVRDYTVKKDWTASLRLPDKWTADFAHYLGWVVGDGCISGNFVTTVYGGGDDQDEILPRHQRLLAWMNGDREPKPSVQENGTVQLRQSRRVIARFLEALGISHSKASEKRIPWAIRQAPPEIVAAFLQGLFDADGCVYDGENSRYVGLGSSSPALLKDVQQLLSTAGVFSRIYNPRKGSKSVLAYTGKDGVERTYTSKPMYDLRIANRSVERFAGSIGFSLPAKHDKLAVLLLNHDSHETKTTVRLVERADDGVELTYNLSEPRNHSYVVQGICVRNCSEYMSLDNSACNLASLNLMKFLNDDDSFDIEGYQAAIEVVFTAQEILVGNADYPTRKIAETTRRFRQLGLGYANLGALLMAQGLAYDSDGGRAWAGALTALMTGHAYATSARTAGRMGPHAGYAENREPMLDVLRMHREEVARIDDSLVPKGIVQAAQAAWDEAVELGEAHGVRNSQATVLAPTGCLVGGSLVATDRGLVRLRSLGDPDGAQWQDLDAAVMTDEGARPATQFYVNGLETVVDVETGRGYRIQGTTKHRIKVVDGNGEWVWRRFSDLRSGDTVPLALNQLFGEARAVSLPPLAETSHWTGEHHVQVPRTMTPELAELVGYFMGDGSLHAKGLRLCVADTDLDVVDHFERLVKSLFGLQATARPQQGYTSLEVNSVRLVEWWSACGFARRPPHPEHQGKGYEAHVPDAVLHANDPEVYRAFLRGLFEADGTVTVGYPSWTTTTMELSHDVQTMLLALGFVTTRRLGTNGRGSLLAVLRLLNKSANARWLDEVGFISERKARAVDTSDYPQSARPGVRGVPGKTDHIPVSRELIDRVVPENGRERRVALMEHRRTGAITRRLAEEIHAATGDEELGRRLGFFYDRIARAELGGEELTYDLSVPDNVTYVANGFVSHNTIGLMMDCDTTGIEPDLALTKAKKLVGGGTMFIVNQTVPRALKQLGYSPDQVERIIAHIDEHKTILGAPGLKVDHLPVFACAMGDNPIHYMGHVKMMGAVQPFISGAISKCVVGETLLSTADGLVRIGGLHRGEAPDTFREEVIEVASLGGTRKTDAFYYGGTRPVREVALRSGHRVIGTPNHRLLVAGRDGLAWRRLDEIAAGEYVALRYGADLWSAIPARIEGFEPTPSHGPQKPVRIPREMSGDLAFLLGAYAACGRLSRSNWTVTVAHPSPPVLERLASVWRARFGVDARISRPDGRCPSVSVASKTVVEFLDHIGAGERAAFRRIPDAVLASPRETVLAYVEGLLLTARAGRAAGALTVTVPLGSTPLLEDLQSVLTNLGVVHQRVDGEIEATGDAARRLLGLVPLADP
ncbi:MAG TPA: LAGLIDADG family homing endonuclease, partial [Acidimicrobiia bacterium]|nr:LAGLIDADG family homing endonuclease [Acidimicrobiia bacterium]